MLHICRHVSAAVQWLGSSIGSSRGPEPISEGLAHHDARALLPGLTSSWCTALVACWLLIVPQRCAGVDLPFLAFDVALAAPVTPSADRGFQHRLAFLRAISLGICAIRAGRGA